MQRTIHYPASTAEPLFSVFNVLPSVDAHSVVNVLLYSAPSRFQRIELKHADRWRLIEFVLRRAFAPSDIDTLPEHVFNGQSETLEGAAP